MYKIVNNNISITRGETATYNVKVIDKSTGAPFVLPPRVSVYNASLGQYTEDINRFVILFGVRSSDYVKDGYAIKKFLWLCGVDSDLTDEPEQFECNDIIILDTDVIYDYNEKYVGGVWSTTYNFIDKKGNQQDNTLKALYRLLLPDGSYEYKYWNPTNSTWNEYTFTIRFPFFYGDTARLSPKSYRYSMTIYGGSTLTIQDGKIDENTITYKKPLVDANFIVEADINE